MLEIDKILDVQNAWQIALSKNDDQVRKLPDLVGMLLKVEFLRPDGTLRYKRLLWLYWTGSLTIPLKSLCRMYLWRFARQPSVAEHYFRFLKQHLGLNANQSTDTVCTDHWMWLCGLAYWQLLLMREEVEDALPAWYPAKTLSGSKIRTPGQVQRMLCDF